MMERVDSVVRQVQAYNARDLEGFLACYAEDVVIEDAEGKALMRGLQAMRSRYGLLFTDSPEPHAEIVTRIRVGRYVIDEEWVTGTPGGDVHAAAIYRLDDDGLIDRVRFLR